ncbi:MAG TPA: LysR substrate-binding domain-containing protein [Minicystis sp.]|nr:LysR substrate-binding domain-containing protein [Minicystis sp.]
MAASDVGEARAAGPSPTAARRRPATRPGRIRDRQHPRRAETARGGVGIGALAEYLARDDVAAGALRELLPGALPVTRKIYALDSPSRHLPPQVRAFVDLLVRDAASPPS